MKLPLSWVLRIDHNQVFFSIYVHNVLKYNKTNIDEQLENNMTIKTIEISGFRQISNATFNLEDRLTFLAGANNSGKTSLVELLNCVFNFGTEKLSGEDFSVVNTQQWVNAVYPQILNYFQEDTQKENIISNRKL